MNESTTALHIPAGDDGRTVLVVVASPVGLVAACELVRQGARVRLIDALAEPTTQSRAVTVHPRMREHLAAMGVLDRLETKGLAQTCRSRRPRRSAPGWPPTSASASSAARPRRIGQPA